jgi:hypothetical protein
MVFDFAVTLGGNPVDLTSAGLWFTAKMLAIIRKRSFLTMGPARR